MQKNNVAIFILNLVIFVFSQGYSQLKEKANLNLKDLHIYNKPSENNGYDDRKYFFMNGNKVSGNIYNYGAIAPGEGLIRHVNNMVWNGLGDVYQLMPMVLAEIKGSDGKIYHISSDALNDAYGRDISPDGRLIYGWEPLLGYADPNQPYMASNIAADLNRDGKPDNWPNEWYDSTQHKYIWPNFIPLSQKQPDLEIFWGMDDRDNREFPYYPFLPDSLRMGLGIKVEGRAFQWKDKLLEDCIFFNYKIINISTKDLSKVRFAMYCDFDVGGGYSADPTSESRDDCVAFISPLDISFPQYSRDLVCCWDYDGIGHLGLKTNYVGIKQLEYIKEQSSKIGLTSFYVWQWSAIRIADDEEAWRKTTPGYFDKGLINSDIVILIGTGDFSLKSGESKTVSYALIYGSDQNDLILNAENAQKAFNNNYDLAKLGVEKLNNSKNPSEFLLYQNYPNPFNPETKIQYSISEDALVNLKIFDVWGREIETLVDKVQSAGTYSINWLPINLPSGVYYYKIIAGKYNEIKKMIYIR
jgi:hypothetical protein